MTVKLLLGKDEVRWRLGCVAGGRLGTGGVEGAGDGWLDGWLELMLVTRRALVGVLWVVLKFVSNITVACFGSGGQAVGLSAAEA